MTLGKTYFSGAHLKNLRNRTYFDRIIVNGRIESEGSWKIELRNQGDVDVFIKDGAGNVFDMIAFNLRIPLILDGSPEMVRDDILEIEFIGAGLNPLLCVIFHRIVERRDDGDYPVNQYDK